MSAGPIRIQHPRARPSLSQHPSFHSSHLSQPQFPAVNGNSAFQFGLDRCRIPGLYKPAHPDTRQDLTATLTRVNNSGSGFSSPSLLQPCTKPFSGLPSRRQMTSPTREAGEATRERPGVVYPLLPRAQRPDTRVVIEAALPEAAALDRRAQPPTVLEIAIPPCPSSCHFPDDAPHDGSHANAVAIALRAYIGRPSARRPTDAGVSKDTLPPGINKTSI